MEPLKKKDLAILNDLELNFSYLRTFPTEITLENREIYTVNFQRFYILEIDKEDRRITNIIFNDYRIEELLELINDRRFYTKEIKSIRRIPELLESEKILKNYYYEKDIYYYYIGGKARKI